MKTKFDVFVWDEVKTNEKVTHSKGQLWLRASAPCALYIEAQGVEALAGYASEFDLEVSEAVAFRIEAPKAVRAFVYSPLSTSTVADGEVFTNIDRKPHESGAMAEVLKARRMLEIEKKSMLADIRREMAIVKNAARPKAKTEDTPQEGGTASVTPDDVASDESEAEA